ncbi:Carbohydrate-selective porin OprB [Candidatus Sulfotelmatomonas gaucii]|uniref:Carbohydrate-selective porin OprB n=1 Tax=Candidatus Sulfuritelmatomonas gaucii TaxID=2043161 RepID=A0A2N9LYT5_9BACT|nr:Carbohydrate-selective porin OprB [Candidatus Sulfotelmatomonas gaucii]
MNDKTKIYLVAPAMLFGLAFFSGASAWCQNEARSEARINAPTPNVAAPAAAETYPPDPVVLSTKAANEAPEGSQWQSRNWHMQSTIVGQGYPSFRASYSAANSLPARGQARETVSLDFYGGYRLWNGAEFHVDLLSWQGFGLHGTLGIDDFPNGEAYKVGTRAPHLDIARFFIRQTIGLGGEKEAVPSDQLTLAGDEEYARLTLTAGRFSSKDIFDSNAYSNDPRTQFMNWALVADITWDYPADSLGYTTGVAAELDQSKWSLRYGFFQLPNQRNGFTAEAQYLMWPSNSSAGDFRFFHNWGMVVEGEHRFRAGTHPGAVRALGYLNQGEFGSYEAALSVPGADISQTYANRHTFGFGLNAEQEITRNIGMFSRVGWNDGHNEAWMFTDVNHSASLGISIKGERWHHPDDTVGLAGVFSGASRVNQEFLAAGGAGILDGDGALNYGVEKVVEAYYNHRFPKHLQGCLDYQFVADPAFNRARGPVSVLGTRLHWDF